jgi:hypothetical protein
MHEYIRETSSWKYEACKCCNYRTPFTCVKCTYCWSCHWKKERIERNEFLRNRIRPTKNQRVTDQVVNNKTIATGVSQLQQDKMGSIQGHHLPRRTMINVFGEEEPDPICNYLVVIMPFRCTHIQTTTVEVVVAVDIQKTLR